MTVTPEDVADYIDEVLRDSGRETLKCPVCGNEEWALPPPDGMKGAVPVGAYDAAGPRAMEQHIPFVWIRCARCAYLLMFAKKAIDKWKRSKTSESMAKGRSADVG